MNNEYYIEAIDDSYAMLKTSKNLKKGDSNNCIFFFFEDEFDFTIKIFEWSKLYIRLKKLNKIIVKFEINVSEIFEYINNYKLFDEFNVLNRFTYYDEFLLDFKYKDVVYEVLLKYLPDEIIDIIISFLKHIIDYSFKCQYKHGTYLCLPVITLPTNFLE